MEERACKNCRHFVQYYRKRLTALAEVNCGHCKIRKFKEKEKKPPLGCGCELWELAQYNNERTEGIKTVIRKMQKSLEQIAILLQNENEP